MWDANKFIHVIINICQEVFVYIHVCGLQISSICTKSAKFGQNIWCDFPYVYRYMSAARKFNHTFSARKANDLDKIYGVICPLM